MFYKAIQKSVMLYSILFVLFSLTPFCSVFSQGSHYLIIDKYTKKRFRYYQGNEVYFRLSYSRSVYQGNITKFSKTGFLIAQVKDTEFALKDIQSFYHYRKRISKIKRIPLTLAVGTILLTTLPELIRHGTQDTKYLVNTLAVSGGFILLRQTLRLFEWKTLNKKKYRMRILFNPLIQF